MPAAEDLAPARAAVSPAGGPSAERDRSPASAAADSRSAQIVGIGGTKRRSSGSETALRLALESAAAAGAQTRAFTAADIDLPLYDPSDTVRGKKATALAEAVAQADGLIIASPGYHGTVSGTIKNALDYIEDLRNAERPYLDGLPVGCIAVAYGWQAAGNTLRTLRDVVHSLRGWPTPYGAAINAASGGLTDGRCSDVEIAKGLELVGTQVVTFIAATGGSRAQAGAPHPPPQRDQ